MKLNFLRYSLPAYLLILSACFTACSRKDEPTPGPGGPPATVAGARAWFRQQARPLAKGQMAARGDSSTELTNSIDWDHALLADNKLVAPFADTLHRFTRGQYGYRFLVAQVAPDSTYAGRIVELVTPNKPATPQQAAQLVLDGTEPLLAGQAPGPVADFTGALVAYSPAYAYETGLAYQDGAVQPGRLQLSMSLPTNAPAGSCYDFFLVGYDNTGTQVVNEPLGMLCAGGIPPLGTGWGGGGGTSTTGGGGGGSPQQVAAIDQSGLKPCQQAVLQKLQALSGNRLLDIVKLFSGANPNYNWIVKNGSNTFGHMGDTNFAFNLSTNSATSTFDGSQMSAATDLAVACTMLHESIHAYLTAYYNNALILGNGSASGTPFGTEYPALVIAYNTYNITKVDIAHHTEMAVGGSSNGWIGDIAWTLKQYGLAKGYNLTDQFYMDLAWSGLLNTSAFNALSAADKVRIQNVVTIECYSRDYRDMPSTDQKGTRACN